MERLQNQYNSSIKKLQNMINKTPLLKSKYSFVFCYRIGTFMLVFQMKAFNYSTSVIRQKGESQNGCFKKVKHAELSEKRTFLTL